jgi:hypothetical protein
VSVNAAGRKSSSRPLREAGVLLLANVMLAEWLERTALVRVARSAQDYFLTGTAITILAALLLLVGLTDAVTRASRPGQTGRKERLAGAGD